MLYALKQLQDTPKKNECNNDGQAGNIRINLIQHAVKSLTTYKIISNEIRNAKVKAKGS